MLLKKTIPIFKTFIIPKTYTYMKAKPFKKCALVAVTKLLIVYVCCWYLDV